MSDIGCLLDRNKSFSKCKYTIMDICVFMMVVCLFPAMKGDKFSTCSFYNYFKMKIDINGIN